MDEKTAGPPMSEREASQQWGSLSMEPCRRCRQIGGVQFWASEQPLDLTGSQTVRCALCGCVWDTDGRMLN